MDGQRFDDLTRRMTAIATRRRVLAVAAGLLGGAAIAGDASAGAPRTGGCRPALVGCTRHGQCCGGVCQVGRHLPRSRRNRCACDAGREQCGDACVELATDERHCGECGFVCDDDETCVSGVCEPKLDCTTFNGTSVQSGQSWCVTTIDGESLASLPCGRSLLTTCETSDDCADEARNPGETAVCAASLTWCYAPYVCKPSLPGAGYCVVIQTVVCPA